MASGYTSRSTLYNTFKHHQKLQQQQCKEYGRYQNPFQRKTELQNHLFFVPKHTASWLARTGYTSRSTMYNTFKHHQKLHGGSQPPFHRKTEEVASSAKWVSKFGIVGWYLGMVKTRPVLTKSVTSAFIYTAADFTSQTMAKLRDESYDLVRTLRMGGYGLLILGPSLHYWFNFVSKILPKRDLFSTVKKIALAQTVYGPCMTVVFFSANAALQGERGEEIIARLKRDVVPTMINGVMYWPLCDFITFKFIPVHLQPLVSNSFSYLWNVYMTYMASLKKVG